MEKVYIEFNTMDMEGNKEGIKAQGNLSIEKGIYKVTYKENMSKDEPITSHTQINIEKTGLKMRRHGDVFSEFIYENGLTHNSYYETPYGKMPVTMKTILYEMKETARGVKVFIEYLMTLDQTEPIRMKLNIRIEKVSLA